MYKVTANTRNDYLKEAMKSGRDLKSVDAFIQQSAPALQPWFYNVGLKQPGMTFKMMAYGKFSYVLTKNTSVAVEWPVIGIALQKNYISVYISVTRKNKPLVDYYKDQLGATRYGKNNFSFESFDQLNKTALSQIVKETEQIFKEDPLNPMRFKES